MTVADYVYILISLYRLSSPFHCLFVVKLSSIEEISQRVISDCELNYKIKKQKILSVLHGAISTNTSASLRLSNIY